MKVQVWPPLPDTYRRSGRLVWQACCLGEEPAESLHTIDREHLVVTLVAAGWKPAAIATVTRMTWYTTARIIGRADGIHRGKTPALQFEGRAA